MFRLKANDSNRIDELTKLINTEIEKQGMKPVRSALMLRALIFHGLESKPEDLIKAINKARMYA